MSIESIVVLVNASIQRPTVGFWYVAEVELVHDTNGILHVTVLTHLVSPIR